jgi:hypothetical protein
MTHPLILSLIALGLLCGSSLLFMKQAKRRDGESVDRLFKHGRK